MKYIFSFISILLLFSPLALNSQETISWSKGSKLNWNDFQAEPNENIIAYALTATKIEIIPEEVLVDEKNNISNYKDLTVVANFYKKHSWVFKKSESLLKHEQLHFDIAGLYAKKIRLEFEKLQANKISNFDEYISTYNRLYKECRAMQKNYDQETNHGQNTEINEAWEKKVAELLL